MLQALEVSADDSPHKPFEEIKEDTTLHYRPALFPYLKNTTYLEFTALKGLNTPYWPCLSEHKVAVHIIGDLFRIDGNHADSLSVVLCV